MLNQFTTWLQNLFIRVFTAAWNFITDAFIWLVDQVLIGVTALFNAVPAPEFLAGGINGQLQQLSPGILWGVSQAGLPACLAIIGSGFAFRLLRKLLTLGQW